jgi:hypothetical protein
MARRRPDLIVPIHDRRKHRRIVTLRNFRNALLVFAVFFVALTVASELRKPVAGAYGRLVAREIGDDVARKPVEVVTEAPPPVNDQTAADPMLLAPAARAQYLSELNTNAPAPATPLTTAQAETLTPSFAAPAARGTNNIAIVGGADGVTVVQHSRGKPVLSGGFGR